MPRKHANLSPLPSRLAFFGGYDIYASVTLLLIIIHNSFMLIRNHGSIHINVEVFRNIFLFLFTIK
ncbi:hypothetical protein ACCT32_35950, partial [Rhizobium brockwellii]|uniref:hypothetical protein n=1 Tax=Rhizobium brockwellii TaxID=3019932 RepID=UPI003F9E436F